MKVAFRRWGRLDNNFDFFLLPNVFGKAKILFWIGKVQSEFDRLPISWRKVESESTSLYLTDSDNSPNTEDQHRSCMQYSGYSLQLNNDFKETHITSG